MNYFQYSFGYQIFFLYICTIITAIIVLGYLMIIH